MWPLCSGEPRLPNSEVAANSSEKQLLQCGLEGCKAKVSGDAMRQHVGAHILMGHCSMADAGGPGPEACGFCGQAVKGDQCQSALVAAKTTGYLRVVSSCQFAHLSMCYGAARKVSVHSPCTNAPAKCEVCAADATAPNRYVWSYHYLDRLQSHGAACLTPQAIEQYAVAAAELRAVLQKAGYSQTAVAAREREIVQGAAVLGDRASPFWNKILTYQLLVWWHG